MVAVIDCGGNSRVGTYPRLGIPTVDIKMQGPAGPLAKFITEDIFVSGVTPKDIVLYENEEIKIVNEENKSHKEESEKNNANLNKDDNKENHDKNSEKSEDKKNRGFIDRVGRAAGKFTSIFYQSGRETIDNVITNILPFMAFIATIIGIINYTGIGNIIAKALVPLSSNIVGLIVVGIIVGLPFLSPLLAPGAVMAAIVGTLIGQQIASGVIPPSVALPALFAINGQVGCDFIPVGLTLGDADPKTVSIATPAVLFSRVITSPVGVLIGFLLSLGM